MRRGAARLDGRWERGWGTRHPSDFGDAAWRGYGLLSDVAGSWWPLLGAPLMTGLRLKVSGVALLEGGLRRSKPGYEAYARRTSAFIPWPPK